MFTCRVASHAFEIEKGGGVVAKGIRGDGVRGVVRGSTEVADLS